MGMLVLGKRRLRKSETEFLRNDRNDHALLPLPPLPVDSFGSAPTEGTCYLYSEGFREVMAIESVVPTGLGVSRLLFSWQ